MPASAANHGAYKKTDVETASQGKLTTMLFNGAIQRAEEAKRQMERKNATSIHNNLIRAQDIIAELRSALDMSTGEIAQNLDRLYEYIHHLLIQANIHKDPARIDESVALMTELRDTWKEAFEKAASEAGGVVSPPQLNQHGAAVIDLQG